MLAPRTGSGTRNAVAFADGALSGSSATRTKFRIDRLDRQSGRTPEVRAYWEIRPTSRLLPRPRQYSPMRPDAGQRPAPLMESDHAVAVLVWRSPYDSAGSRSIRHGQLRRR